MSDWQVGDLALCVKTTPWKTVFEGGGYVWSNDGPKTGSVHRVVRIDSGVSGALCLHLEGWLRPADTLWTGFNARCFRKVNPPEADEFDREIIDLLTKQPAEVI